ncbi:MAG TPA: 50S ribosomal protein L30 [Actinomycetota bacterium]|jgi:large subunit ribosomal protein L30|nr:50S ribosomal protein L30 [Actinomycetota bacterium]
MARLKVTQVRGVVGRPQGQKDTIRALGLKRIRHSVVKEDRPEIRGMISRVAHLVVVEEVKE